MLTQTLFASAACWGGLFTGRIPKHEELQKYAESFDLLLKPKWPKLIGLIVICDVSVVRACFGHVVFLRAACFEGPGEMVLE